jgi:hypothetical protein
MRIALVIQRVLRSITSRASFVAPQVALFRQVPFRVSVKFPHSPQDSPYTPEGERPRVDALSRRERSDPSLAHDRHTRVAPIHLHTAFTDIEAKA